MPAKSMGHSTDPKPDLPCLRVGRRSFGWGAATGEEFSDPWSYRSFVCAEPMTVAFSAPV